MIRLSFEFETLAEYISFTHMLNPSVPLERFRYTTEEPTAEPKVKIKTPDKNDNFAQKVVKEDSDSQSEPATKGLSTAAGNAQSDAQPEEESATPKALCQDCKEPYELGARKSKRCSNCHRAAVKRGIDAARGVKPAKSAAEVLKSSRECRDCGCNFYLRKAGSVETRCVICKQKFQRNRMLEARQAKKPRGGR